MECPRVRGVVMAEPVAGILKEKVTKVLTSSSRPFQTKFSGKILNAVVHPRFHPEPLFGVIVICSFISLPPWVSTLDFYRAIFFVLPCL